jgi:hypothetical protein
VERDYCCDFPLRGSRSTGDVENVTGKPAFTVEQYIAAHPDPFS